MADQNQKITIISSGGSTKIRCLSGTNEYTLEPGWKPGTGIITISSEDKESLAKLKDEPITLEIVDFKERVLKIKNLFIESFHSTNNGTRYELRLEDNRAQWEFQGITGHWNCTSEDGKTWLTKSLKSGTDRHSLKDFVDDCVEALTRETEDGAGNGEYIGGEDLEAVEGSNPTAPLLRNVSWIFANAGRAAHGALKKAGGFISRDWAGKIVVCTGDSDIVYSRVKKLEDEAIEKPSAATQIAHKKPKYLRVAFKTIREKEFTNSYFEAALQHDGKDKSGAALGDGEPVNGEWCAASEVLEDWGLSEGLVRDNFTEPDMKKILDLQSCSDDLKEKRVKIIKTQFYRHFRFKGPLTTSTEARTQILPLEPYLASATTEDGTRVPALAGECSWHSKGKKDSKEVYLTRSGTVPPFTIRVVDAKAGVIKFDSQFPVCGISKAKGDGKVYEDYKLEEPSIKVKLAFTKKASTDDWRDDYWFPNTTGYEDAANSSANNGKTKTVIAEEALLEVDDSGTWEKQNETELTDYAEKYAEDYFRQLRMRSGSNVPREIKVAGVRPSIDRLDSHVRGIKVEFGASGIFTTFRINDDLPLNPWTLNFPTEKPELSGTGETVKFSEASGSGGGGGSGLRQHLDPGGLYQSDNMPRDAAAEVKHEESRWINDRNVGVSIAEGMASPSSQASGAKRSGSGGDLMSFLGQLLGELGWTAWGAQNGYFSPGVTLQTQVPAMRIGDEPRSYTTIEGFLARLPDPYRRRAEQAGFLPAGRSGGGGGGGGSSSAAKWDPRSTFGRVTGTADNGGLEVEKISKHDKYWEENLGHWISKLVAYPLEAGQMQETPATGSGAVQVSGNINYGPGRTYSQPAQPPATPAAGGAGAVNHAPAGDQSTRVWDKSVEWPEKAQFGRFNQLFIVNDKHSYGEDGDGNKFRRLELNKNVMHWYKDKNTHGPVMDYGDADKPQRTGTKIPADLIYRRALDAWDWIAWVNPATVPPGEPGPTPNPVPPDQPSWPPWPGPGTPTPWPDPTEPPGGGGDGGGWPGWPSDPDNPFGFPPWKDPGWEPVPGGGLGGIPADGGVVLESRASTCPSVNAASESWRGGLVPWRPGYNTDNRGWYSTRPSALPWGYWPQVPGLVNAPLWRVPGTQFPPNAASVAYPSRTLARIPGTAPSPTNTVPVTSFDSGDYSWGQTALAAETIEDEDYNLLTLSSGMKALVEGMNEVLARLNILDARSRADYNVKDLITITAGDSEVEYTTAHAYDSQPSVQATSTTDPTSLDVGNVSAHSWSQNLDGTWTGTIEIENADGAGLIPATIALDIKGSVSDSEDVDA